MQWRLSDDGLVAGGQQGSLRNYSDPQLVAASPWNITNNGFNLRFEFEPSGNCANDGSNLIQKGHATSSIRVTSPTNISFNWTGEAESVSKDYDIMKLDVDGQQVANATSSGGQGGTCDMSPVLSTPRPPITVLLPIGRHEVSINLNTIDSNHHYGAFYEFHLTLH